MAVFTELRRRNVFKVALLYAVASWLVVWFVEALQANMTLPVWTETFALFMLAVGFPIALWFAWTYEITPVGLKKAVEVDQTQSIVYKTGQKLNAAVAVLLVLGILAVFGQRLLPKFEFILPGIPEGDAPMSSRSPVEIRSLTLSNGLKIIVWPDHDIPNVTMYTFVKAGARNEYPGITGVSHFFEHMMFLGTEDLPPKEFDRVMEAAGGANNAYTTADVTVYTDWFPRSAVETIFEIEGDRFENLKIDPDVFNSEREVVYSERRSSIDNNNFWKLAEQVQATAFLAHPYQFTVIGWPSDIESWTQEDLTNYYRTYYAPNNRVVVITGDITTRAAFGLAEEYFAPTPAQPPPPPIRTVEPEQTGVRRILVAAPAQTPLLQMAFHVENAAAPESLVMTLLLNILAEGDSSRLHQVLVEKQGLALSVDSHQDEGFDPGLAWLAMTLPPGGNPEEVERRVIGELQRVFNDGVSEDELTKAKNIVLSDYWRALSTIRGKASALGRFEVFHGNYEALFNLPTDVESVTTEDIRAVAGKVFRVSNMTVGVLQEPKPEGSR
jgi:zinc protease